MQRKRMLLKILSLLLTLLFINLVSMAAEVRISFWHTFSSSSPRGKALQYLVNEFNNQQYKIGEKVIVVDSVYKGGKGKYNNPYNVLFSELLKASYTKELPNVSIAYENWVSQFKEVDIIKNFDSFNSQELKNYFDILYPEFKNSATIDGKVYSIPFNKSLFVLYYNSDIIDSLPTNFSEFIKKLEEIKNRIGNPPLYLEPNEDVFITFYLLSVSNDFFKVNKKIYPTFLGENMKKTTSIISDLEKKGLIKWTGNSYKDFIENRAPIILATTSRYTDLKARNKSYKISPLPADNGKIYAAGTNLVIFKAIPEQELASLKFIEFLIKYENIEYFCINTGYIVPTVVYSKLYGNFLNSNPEYGLVLEYSKDKIYVQQPIWAWENIRYFLGDYMFNVFISKSSSVEYQQEIEKKVNDILFNQNQIFNKGGGR